MSIMPESPVGRQLAWYLNRVESGGEGASGADRAHFATGLSRPRWMPLDADLHEGWRQLSLQIGDFELASVDDASDFTISVTIQAGPKRWRVSCQVEEREPHCISGLDWQRLFEFDVSVREATEADAKSLSDIERRCPVVLGDTSVTFDRGDDYFAFSRLMEDVTVALGFVDGAPAAINCGAVHSVRIDDIERRVMTAIHTRILPKHQRKGLWGAVSRLLGDKYSAEVEGSRGYVSVDNAAMQKGFENTPDRWDTSALRAMLDCASLAGPAVGRPATPSDAARIVEILNAFHGPEEMYLPYTVQSLTTRLERAPKQYPWDRVWMTDSAVVGVWPAGESIRVVGESGGKQTESRRGLVLDYGFLEHAEAEFERLLRAWCAWLRDRGLETLSIFTSERSPGYARLAALAGDIHAFDLWTPGIRPPPGEAERGLYVDQVYF